MKEYIADESLDKKLAKKVRKNFKRHKVGTIIIFVLIVFMVLTNLWLISHAENLNEVVELLIVGSGLDVLFFIAILIARAISVSGGRDILLNRKAEKCKFTEDAFILEYIPSAHETMDYECICQIIRYTDIEKIVEEDTFGRLAVYGSYEILEYRDRDKSGKKDAYKVSDIPFYIYNHYHEYEEIKEQLRKRLHMYKVL